MHLAQRIGMNETLLSQYVNGKKNPSKRQIKRIIRSNNRGLLKSDLKAGDRVNQGDIVGYMQDSFGETIKVLKAPCTGIILYKIGTPPVNVGETIMCIAYP